MQIQRTRKWILVPAAQTPMKGCEEQSATANGLFESTYTSRALEMGDWKIPPVLVLEYSWPCPCQHELDDVVVVVVAYQAGKNPQTLATVDFEMNG